ncbi:MAG TPA: hypothetical protein VN618_06590 [Solirubrobacteraceae bacterium]|nr:hypothetical protein [Solirubrobacteraceae bacterium]
MSTRRAFFCAAHLAVAVAALLPPVAAAASESQVAQSPVADQGSSFRYRSVITAVAPRVAGLSVQVLQFADRLLLVNHTGRTVTVDGYEGEPYARLLADGTTELNVRSPAYYLNKTFFGDVQVPAQADAKAPPEWRVLDRTGQLEWHDHRIHYTSPAVPPQVKDKGRRTLIFDWKIPISVGSQTGAVEGQLFWVPESSSVSVAVIAIGVVIVLGGLVLVLYVRRRRRGASPGASASKSGRDGGDEAW